MELFNSFERTFERIILDSELIYTDCEKTVYSKPMIRLSVPGNEMVDNNRILNEITHLFELILKKPRTLHSNTGWNVFIPGIDDNIFCIKFKSLSELYVKLKFKNKWLCAIDSHGADTQIFEEKQILNDSDIQMLDGLIYYCTLKMSMMTQKWIIDIKNICGDKIPGHVCEIHSIMQRIKINWTAKQLIDVFKANDHIYYDSLHDVTKNKYSRTKSKCINTFITQIDLVNKNVLDLNADAKYAMCNKNANKYCTIGINPKTLSFHSLVDSQQHGDSNMQNKYLIWGNIKNNSEGLEGLEYFTDYETLGLFDDIDTILCIDILYECNVLDIKKICDMTKQKNIKLIICDTFTDLVNLSMLEQKVKMSMRECINLFETYGWKFTRDIKSIDQSENASDYLCLIFEK